MLNGGLNDIQDCINHLKVVDGIMIGRHAYRNPWFLNKIKRAIQHSDDHEVITRRDIVEKMFPYIEEQLKEGIKLKNITRHMLGLFSNQPGAKSVSYTHLTLPTTEAV